MPNFLLEDVELGLTTQKIEEEGFLLDISVLTKRKAYLEKEEKQLRAELNRIAKKDVNPLSPPQTWDLFTSLGVVLPKRKDTGNPNTSELSIRKTVRNHSPEVRHVADLVLGVRGIRKELSTYVNGFLQRVNSQGWLHSRFRFPGTITWRLSSSDPNIQNIPHGVFRNAFIAPPGFVICECDYSQIELRVAAAVANEEALRSVFMSGGDPHGMLGRKIFKVGVKGVLSYGRRQRAKTTNFGLLYGAGALVLSDQFLKKGDYVSVSECKAYHKVFWDTYTSIRTYMDMQKATLESGGYVASPEGGYLWSLEDMVLAHFGNRREALLSGANAPIQSVAPRLTLRAAREAQRQGIRVIGQVHDSLLAYLPERTAERDALRLKRIMEAEGEADWWGGVPCLADVEIGPNWNEMRTVT